MLFSFFTNSIFAVIVFINIKIIFICVIIFLQNKQQIILTQPSGAGAPNAFAHGQIISFGDGQQAILVQNADQNGTPQSMRDQ